jgi:hypothetical protein
VRCFPLVIVKMCQCQYIQYINMFFKFCALVYMHRMYDVSIFFLFCYFSSVTSRSGLSKYVSDVVVFHLRMARRGQNMLWTKRIKVTPINSQLRSQVYLRGIRILLRISSDNCENLFRIQSRSRKINKLCICGTLHFFSVWYIHRTASVV